MRPATGLAAALHTPSWAREHPDEGRLLLFYSRHDFVQGDWPADLQVGVEAQARRFRGWLERFADMAFRTGDGTALRRATFVLADVPIAAVKRHLQVCEAPPLLVDELIATTYRAIVGEGR